MVEVHERNRPVFLRVGHLFDGEHWRHGPHATVAIDGPTISAIGVPAPDQAIVIDLPGATAMPGLIDTHVHLAFDATDDPVRGLETRSDSELTDFMISAGERALAAGITTVRDLGDKNYLSLALRGRPELPDLLAAGPPVTTPTGHCHFMGGGVPATAAHVHQAIHEHAERGVDVIKVMASGGSMTPGTPQEQSQFPTSLLQLIVDEAHALGLPVTAHAQGTASIVQALDVGADGIEHATFWSASGIDEPGPLIERIATSGIVVGATLGFDPPGHFADLPASLRDRLPRIHDLMAELYNGGARVVVGSDAGVAPVKHHGVLPYAAFQLDAMGLDRDSILRMLTRDAAHGLGLGDQKGSLVPGHQADILVVGGDLSADLQTLLAVEMVLKAGRIAHDTRSQAQAG